MTARPRTAALGLVLLAALAAGCSGTTSEKNTDPTPAADPSATAADRARTYMRAVVADDWTTACNLMSAAERTPCHGRHPTPEPADPSGPAIGPVLLDRPPTRVPATSNHPAGWGVITTHTVTWPGKPARTSYTALRMTEAGGTWWVEQREDVADSDLTYSGDPAASALGRVTG
ncbi:hypothetical protein NRK68_36490 (plasmid) [Streptomyces yangpuensis]|uniref:SnoaL-like domain-containing protein n=1 Tax=Streptomyces yangpuensis TaxID=1648182 RepID=A0ABY5Q8H7_9ACTN|nr:hypothetical protein [Streptomyces yangpuensis]UUY52756.1 hypothetical protein NRK68_36490 [Streptomyces yangpuensis]